jgi:hypothetical protein
MKTSIMTFGALIVSAAISSAAVLAITPSSPTPYLTGNETSQNQIDAVLAGLNLGLIEVYKQNVGGPEVGSLASSYTTAFSNTPSDPSDATITYVGTPGAITDPADYLLVKDGNQTPAWYLFDLTGWNGEDTIQMSGFWPNQGAISHVTLYSGRTTTRVPDNGATLVSLGIALLGLGSVRKLLGSKA